MQNLFLSNFVALSYPSLDFSAATAAADSPTAQSWASMSYTKLLVPKLTLIPPPFIITNEGYRIPFTLPKARPFFWGATGQRNFDPKKKKINKTIPYMWEYWAVLTLSESVFGEENLPCSHIDAAADSVSTAVLTTIPHT